MSYVVRRRPLVSCAILGLLLLDGEQREANYFCGLPLQVSLNFSFTDLEVDSILKLTAESSYLRI